jgi:hypothetical protein
MGATLEFPPAQGDQWLQLIHNGSNHWVCVAKGFSQPNHVLVYDSMPSTPWKNDHILSCMSSLLYTQEKKMTYIVKSCQRQSNGYDCGVFAIAFATSLANGEDPASRLYNPKKLRAQLFGFGNLNAISIGSNPSQEVLGDCTGRRAVLHLSPNRMGEKGVDAPRM